ncbi:hypothetical protein NKJ90_32215 [Mesorhizobium sp. M0051]|uniref:hypothetical protein n=1 Tax=unclassified Mesorhizobium TaxID=325217 RepID=UPI0003CDF2A8|nr:hypothetical protein [Mesorhizobium sp. LNHC252B00]ESY62688.1 hypothetical protein X743_34150 [Mesorhizobium sp. LNHC252B00]
MFREFEAKYSILIDMRGLDSAMSDHHVTMIVSGVNRLSPSRQPMPTTSGPGGPFAIPLLSKGIFVLSRAQSKAKTAAAA